MKRLIVIAAVIFSALRFVTGCHVPAPGTQPAPPTAHACAQLDTETCGQRYTAALVACNATAKTLQDSQACEDGVRAVYGRPPRELADGGAR